LRADLEAAEAPWLVTAIPAGAARATSAATTATVPAAISAAATVAAPAIVTPPALRRGHAVDRVMILAARDRAVRALFALEHADQAHLVEAVADDIERLDQPGGTVGLDRQRAGDRVDDRIGLLLDRRIGCGRIGSRNLGCCLGITGRCV